jgi:aspartyl/asparaginyl-tRNA synthetase
MKDAEGNKVYNSVGIDTRLNNRVLDLRVCLMNLSTVPCADVLHKTPISQSIFAIQAAVTSFFRGFLESKGFIEIHSPKLQAAATESGASVFEVSYFKGTRTS